MTTLASIAYAFVGVLFGMLVGGLAISAVRQLRADRELREYRANLDQGSYTAHTNAGAA